MKLKTVEAVNTLASQFIQRWMAANKKEPYKPTLDRHEEFSATDAKVEALFSASTYQIFKDLEKKVDPNLADERSYPNVESFIKARDTAVKALYNEVV